jgi:phosphotransferase system HPr-like phosphotransfer protein
MIRTFKLKSKHGVTARVAGSILMMIHETINSSDDITLIYNGKIADARQLISWFEFSFHEYDEFSISTNNNQNTQLFDNIEQILSTMSV